MDKPKVTLKNWSVHQSTEGRLVFKGTVFYPRDGYYHLIIGPILTIKLTDDDRYEAETEDAVYDLK